MTCFGFEQDFWSSLIWSSSYRLQGGVYQSHKIYPADTDIWCKHENDGRYILNVTGVIIKTNILRILSEELGAW